MIRRVVVSAMCCALWVLSTGCGDECVDAFDCRSDEGQPPDGQEWTCNADNECELRAVTVPEEDAGTDAGVVDAGTDAGMDAGMDAGTDAGTEDAGTDAGTDAGVDGGSMTVGKDGPCVFSGDCIAGFRCEGTPSTCQAMHLAVTGNRESDGTPKALVARYETPGMTALSDGDTSSRYPRWGPGGTRISFAQGAVETGDPVAGALVVRDIPLAAGQATVLADGGTGNTESFRYMEWEPGAYIAYVRRNGTSTSGISVVPTDGGTVMTATGEGTFPDWKDATTFAFSTATVGLSTSTVGGSPTVITGPGGTAEQPLYNRVNNQLLFLRRDDTKPEGFDTSLFLIPVSGGTVQPIADFGSVPATGGGGSVDSYVANPNWAPDGTWVAYVRAYYSNPTGGTPVLCGNAEATLCPSDPGNIIHLRKINPSTGAGDGAEVPFVTGGTLPSFSPDGRFLAYIQGGQLYVQGLNPTTGEKVGSAIVHPRGGYNLQTSAGDDHRPRWQPK